MADEIWAGATIEYWASHLVDIERRFLRSLLKMVIDFAERDNIQVIILEKAQVDEYWFEDNIVERLDEPYKLISDHWIELD